MRPRAARTVRARIVAAAVAAVAAVLAVASVVLVVLVRSSLERPMAGEARVRATDVVAVLNAGGLTAPVPALAAPWPTLVQVLDADGAVLTASAELRGAVPLLLVTPARREITGRATLTANGRTQDWRLDAVAASARGRSITVIVATSRAQVERSTGLLVAALAIAGPLLVAVVALLAWWLVGRALRPVEALRRQVAEFDHGPPGRRVEAPTTDDEVGRLAVTLNALLDRLDRAGEQQRRFVADASHELRSPVANIRAALEVAQAHPTSAVWVDVADDVLAQNARMGGLVDDLLLLARAEAGPAGRRDDAVDLAAVVARVRDAAVVRRVPVRVDVDVDGAAVVRGDAAQLERVVENLVSNAVRHAAAGVRVSLARQGRWLELAVADDGPGVPSDQRERIFQRFVRLDRDRSRRGGGAGLGLAIVAEVTAAHGGTVTVGDARPGALFTVRLPAATAEPGSQGPLSGVAVPSAP